MTQASRPPSYVIELYVRGHSAQSGATIASVRATLERRLPGRYSLEVIDVHQQPERVRDQRVLATPTMIRCLPRPSRRSVGQLDTPQILDNLELDP